MTQSEILSESPQKERDQIAHNAQPVSCPVSSNSLVVCFSGVVAFLIGIFLARYLHHLRPTIYISVLVLILTLITTLGVFIPDLLWQKVHLRMRGDLSRPPSPSWSRTLTKFVGLLGSMSFIAVIYWLFSEYKGEFYDAYFYFLRIIVPPWLILAIPYIRFVDARMAEPEDGLWQMGRVVLLKWKDIDGMRIRQHLLGWIVKGFFLPLMFNYTCFYLTKFIDADYSQLHTFTGLYANLYSVIYLMDVGFAVGGYLFSLRLTDTHIRSTEPTVFGWAVALLCYEPFWSRIGHYYLAYEMNQWGPWLQDKPILSYLWGAMILVLLLIYVFATVIFGMRFSNLTHRGILTNGPYRWSKHPAFISKNLSWWLISVPFIVKGSFSETLRHLLLLLLLNGLYYLRAKTEERHLSKDPVYVQYAEWIAQNGLFAVIRKRLKNLARRLLLVLAEDKTERA